MKCSKVLVGGSIVAAVVLSASVAFAKPLSEQQWKQQGNAICKQVNQTIDAAGNEAFAGLGQNERPTDAQMQAFIEQAVPAFEDGVASIVALDEPASLKKNVKKFAVEVKLVVAKIKADPTVLFDQKHSPFTKVDKVAVKLGLKTCANNS